jgi:hypothetical protein
MNYTQLDVEIVIYLRIPGSGGTPGSASHIRPMNSVTTATFPQATSPYMSLSLGGFSQRPAPLIKVFSHYGSRFVRYVVTKRLICRPEAQSRSWLSLFPGPDRPPPPAPARLAAGGATARRHRLLARHGPDGIDTYAATVVEKYVIRLLETGPGLARARAGGRRRSRRVLVHPRLRDLPLVPDHPAGRRALSAPPAAAAPSGLPAGPVKQAPPARSAETFSQRSKR